MAGAEPKIDIRMLAILGSGFLAKQIALCCIELGINVVFVNPDPECEQGELVGSKHIKVIRDFKKTHDFIVGVTSPKIKADLIAQALFYDWQPAKTLIHPKAVVCSPVGFGGFVGANACVGEAIICDYVTIESGATIAYDSHIGKYSTINSGARVINSYVSGFVTVGYNSVLHGVRIASHQTITAGTILRRT